MKNVKAKIFAVLLILGLALVIATFSDAILVFKGDKVNLNDASVSDFNKAALAEGNIDFVYGPFATYEESQKNFGVTTSKKETKFYIVGNFTAESYADMTYEEFYDNVFWTVFSTADKELISQLNDAAKQWFDFLTADGYTQSDVPNISIEFEGKLAKQPDADEYEEYFDDAVNDLAYVDDGKISYSKYRIISGRYNKTTLIFFFAGAVIFILGAAGLLLSARADRRNAGELTEDDLY